MGSLNRISLILCTINRKQDVEVFLESIVAQKYKNVEIIIVEQNKTSILIDILRKYMTINIKHVHIKDKGLSLARNIGLKYVTGEIVGFPDDDCYYFPNTLEQVNRIFQINHLDGLCIRTVNDVNFLIDNKIKLKQISFSNFYKKCNSISLFFKKEAMLNIKFDETLGAGQYFGSSEESDFLFNLLKTNRNIKFSKHIFVYHPVVEINQENYKNRSISYGLGKGAFFKKHLVDLNFYYLYLFILQMLILPILSILKSSFKCSRYLLRYKLNLFIYSWLGYIKYK